MVSAASPASSSAKSRTPLRLNLIENAYDSLNEAFGYVERARVDTTRWKFALLNLVHAVELTLKQRLHQEHELLIWENVDRSDPEGGGKSLSAGTALDRLKRVGVTIDASDRAAITTALKWRNAITHYEVDLVIEEVRENFIILHEFLDRFHDAQFSTSLSTEILDEHLPTALELVASFKRDIVTFRGRSMHRIWPAQLWAAQEVATLDCDGRAYSRLAWGSETHWSTYMAHLVPLDYCPDCAAAVGQLHGPNCDQEECPKCGGQLLSDECDWEPSVLWGIGRPEGADDNAETEEP